MTHDYDVVVVGSGFGGAVAALRLTEKGYHRLPHVTVLAGAGVGGGSLVYANTLYEPDPAFYDDPQWRDIADWEAELAPYYALASRMLGVVRNPTVTASDEAVREVAEEMAAIPAETSATSSAPR